MSTGGQNGQNDSIKDHHIPPFDEPETESSPPENPVCDDVGNTVPDSLQDRFLSRAIIRDMLTQLDQIKNQVMSNDTMTFSLLNLTGFQADMANLRNRLRSAIPYAICPYCAGKCCRACHQMGFVNRETYDASPKKST
jgi:hypothetical protein